MKPSSALEAIQQSGVVAVIRLPDLSAAVMIADVLLTSGITALEFTLTSPGAIEAIAKVRSSRPGALVGAGSVLDPDGVYTSVAAGAQFIVAPNTNARVIACCRELGVAVIPGALTPTEIVNAHELGAAAIKIFPAGQFGPGYFREVLAPLPHMKLMPTGGVTAENAADYLRAGAIAVGVGSALISAADVASQNWDAVSQRAGALVAVVQSARGLA